MDGIAASAVSSLVEKVGEMLIDEASLFVRGVRSDMEEMQKDLDSMKSVLEDPRNAADKTWVDQVRDLAYDTEDCLDKCRLLLEAERRRDGQGLIGFLRGSTSLLKILRMRRQRAKEIGALRARAVQVHGRKILYAKDPQLLPPTSTTTSFSFKRASLENRDLHYVPEGQLVGIDGPKSQLTEWLLGDEAQLTVVSVVGMGGLGKTTLVRNVYDDETATRRFEHCAWIDVSRPTNFWVALSETLPLAQDQPRRSSKPEHRQLMMDIRAFLYNKRYMVVFDDMREAAVWDAIKCVLPNGANGSRVIVTTKLRNITAFTRGDDFVAHEYPMPSLPHEQAWSLFCRRAFRSAGCPVSVEALAERIVRRCDGLPLAIVTVAALLATKSVDYWRRLSDSLGPELETSGSLATVARVLSLGYDDLPQHLKPCFLCFGVFPHMKATRLIRIWIAEGFVRAKDGWTLEEVAREYLEELINRSLLQVSQMDSTGRYKYCQVHDFMREILVNKCKEQNFYTLHHEMMSQANQHKAATPPPISEPPHGKIRRLSILGGSEHVYQSLVAVMQQQHQKHGAISCLRSLITLVSREPTASPLPTPRFYLTFKLLRVLDLEGTAVCKLPDGIDSAPLLKYISLKNTKVHKLPKTVGELLNLETLDLRGTALQHLPTSIINLQNLRNLYVPCPPLGARPMDSVHANWFLESRSPGVKVPAGVWRLRRLEKLALVDVGVVEELGNLTQLRKLGLRCIKREDDGALCQAIAKMSYLRSLMLQSVGQDEPLQLQSVCPAPQFLERLALFGPLERLPSWVPSLHHIVRIILVGSKLSDDLLTALQALPKLVDLYLIGAFAGRDLIAGKEGFRELKMLHVSLLQQLESVRIEKGAMPNLERLSIWYCKALQEVPSGIEYLTNLKELHLVGMDDHLLNRLKGGEDCARTEHIPIVKCSTFIQSVDGKWEGWLEENLSSNKPTELLLREDEE